MVKLSNVCWTMAILQLLSIPIVSLGQDISNDRGLWSYVKNIENKPPFEIEYTISWHRDSHIILYEGKIMNISDHDL